MKRRDFIKSSTALSASGMLTSLSNTAAASTRSLPPSEFPDSIMTGDLQASSGELHIIDGHLPDDLSGHVFIAEGVPLARNHLTPNGKGMLTRVDFNDSHTPGYVRKPIETFSSLMQDQVSGLLDRFNLMGGLIYASPRLGFMNFCNTAPLYLGDQRFALTYEGGIPYEFDAHTLEMVTPIGEPGEWRSSLPPALDIFTPKKWLFPQVRTTAHPYFDSPTGQFYTINYGGNTSEIDARSGFLRLMQWDRKSAFKSWKVIDRQGKNAFLAATSHSFGVTRHFIIIVQTAARTESTRLIGTRIVIPQTHRTPLWIIRRRDLTDDKDYVVADYLELDFDTSDIMCDYDDNGGEITFYGQYLGAMDKSEPQMYLDRLLFGGRVKESISGYPTAPVDVGGLIRARIQVTDHSAGEIKSDFRVIRDQSLCWDMNDPAYRGHFEFPERFEHIYWAAIGYRPEHLIQRVANAYRHYPERFYSNQQLPQLAMPSALIHMDCRQLSITDAYQFPLDCVMRTPQFIPAPQTAAQDQGYIFTAVVRKHPSGHLSSGKEYWLFKADNLAQGPVCILGNPELQFATTNHALWAPSINKPAGSVYKARYADFFKAKLPMHSKQVKHVLEKDIIPRAF